MTFTAGKTQTQAYLYKQIEKYEKIRLVGSSFKCIVIYMTRESTALIPVHPESNGGE
jgi:hypothetical protein